MNSILSTWSSFMNADGVRDRENKFVFTGKRSARGNTHAQELAAAAIHFEQFTRATEELLLKCGAEPRGSRRSTSVRDETDVLRAQGENGGTAWAIRGPLQGAAPGHAIENLTTQ